jgi:cytochrome c-type protein NapC
MSPEILKRAMIVPAAAIMVLWSAHVHAVDWTRVSGKDIVLFYPAQMSWELLLTQFDHSGANKFREGKNCRGCHENDADASGELLVADKNSEPTPIPGKPGFIKANVKAAHDGDRIYIRVEFDPGKQPDAGMDKEFATKIAVMLDDGKVLEATRAGCWAVCHDNLARMPSGANGDTTKYLSRSRVAMTRTGGDQIKSAEDLAKIRAEGGYLEYWQARLTSGAAPQVVDGAVLEKREEHPTPAVSAEASETAGRWSVTFSRKLAAGAPYKDIVPGKTYSIGLSIHAGHTAKRFHYVSFEKTLVMDKGVADLVAARN